MQQPQEEIHPDIILNFRAKTTMQKAEQTAPLFEAHGEATAYNAAYIAEAQKILIDAIRAQQDMRGTAEELRLKSDLRSRYTGTDAQFETEWVTLVTSHLVVESVRLLNRRYAN